MLFPTVEFALFFAVVFPLTWALNRYNGVKKLFLTLASYLFYSFWDWRFVFLLLVSSCFNFIFGLLIGALRETTPRKLAVGAAIVGNLSLLAYFKYYDFLAAYAGALSGWWGHPVDFGSTGVALPVAISFLTFHGMSYVIDVYRGDAAPSRSLVDLMLYIAFFPHLVAGPIVRAHDFLGQLAELRDPADIAYGESLRLILGGLVKKIIIASHIATRFVDPVFINPPDFSSLDLVLAMYAYAIVIYCDFSAYTDIAIGVANLLGYRFPQNFNQPYRAVSLQDFWRRWHMTLSSWLRDYLYVPLGGNRLGTWKTYRNLLVTMGLGGLWHGAGLQFVVWGLMHGGGLAAERGLGVGRDGAKVTGVSRALRWFVTFNFVCVAWIFFRSPNFAAALDYFSAIAANVALPATVTLFVLVLMALGLATQFVPPDWAKRLAKGYERAPLAVQVLIPVATIWLVSVLAPAGVPPFIYFQF